MMLHYDNIYNFLSNKIKNHPNYIKVSKPGNVTHAMNKRLGTESTLKEAVGMNKKNTNFVFGKYKKLDQETLDGLLKTNKYKNLKGLSAIGKQLDKDNYLTQSGVPFRKVKMRSDAKGLNEPGRSSEVLITRKLRDYEIPEKFKIKEGAENLSSKQKKLIKETYARRKKIASYVEKNPSLFTGTSTQKNAGLNILADKFKQSRANIKQDINELLGDDKKVSTYECDVHNKHMLGTPEELQIFLDKIENEEVKI